LLTSPHHLLCLLVYLLQYFVSSDVGGGKQQWYGFHKEPADGSDPPGKSRKARLLEIFGHWCSDVTDLIKATPEADILRRDINDRCVRRTRYVTLL
jgi:zeaxanthin epoxidase